MGKNIKNILIFGASGQIGSNLVDKLQGQYVLQTPNSKYVDFSSPENLKEFLSKLDKKPDLIINSAAYTKVDMAEDEDKLCNNINNESVVEIANYCAENLVTLIHYSTDYVYSGDGENSFIENDISKLKPLSKYGKSKLAGDKAIEKSGCEYIILRTSWVYNNSGNNFVKTMIKLFQERDEVSIVSDQVGSPTYASDIAEATKQIIEKLINFNEIPSGIYHVAPSEQISWYDFGIKIKNELEKQKVFLKIKRIKMIESSEYPTKAKRPLNSRLSVHKLHSVFGIKFPKIDKSLKLAINKILQN